MYILLLLLGGYYVNTLWDEVWRITDRAAVI